MKKSRLHHFFLDVSLVVLLTGVAVYATGFGLCLHMSNANTERMTRQSMQANLNLLYTYIDGQLSTIEHIVLASYWTDGQAYILHDSVRGIFNSITEETGEDILKIDYLISGVSIGLAPPYGGMTPGRYGCAVYYSNIGGGKARKIDIGDTYDYTRKDWYAVPFAQGKPYWTDPYEEAGDGNLITTFGIPIRNNQMERLGVFAVDLSMDRFQGKCREIVPYKSSKTLIIDGNGRFVWHPDPEMLMKNISESACYAALESRIKDCDSGVLTLSDGGEESLLYFEKVPRMRWTICIECPKDEIFADYYDLRRNMFIIALCSILLMVSCLLFLYRRMTEAVAQETDMKSDLNIARKVQMSILPKGNPAFHDRDDINVYGLLRPAKSVGGDMYDYLVRDDKLFFCIGDVAGKGVGASLFMFVVTTLFHDKARRVDSASQIVSSLNEILLTQNKDNTFCTFFVGVLDLKTGRLDYCNAGHEAPVIASYGPDGKLSTAFLEVQSNIALGILEDFHFVEQSCHLLPGDIIFLFTDGVTEAKDASDRIFGIDATIWAVTRVCSRPTAICDKVEKIYDEIACYARGVEQSDDITMLMLEYTGRTITLKNDVGQLPRLAAFANEICDELSVGDDCRGDILVSLDEIGANISMYAYAPGEENVFRVTFVPASGAVVFVFEDSGKPFDPTAAPGSDTSLPYGQLPVGGLGIHITRQLMDKVEYRRVGDRNRLALTKLLKR